MRSTLKLLGSLLTVALVLGVTSLASASLFHSGTPHTLLKGSQITQNIFKLNAGTFSCSTVTFEGTQVAATSEQITLAPNYNKCIVFGFIEVPVHENGCHYTGTVGPGLMHLNCPEKPMEVTVPGCTVTFGSQTMATADFNNNASDTDINLVATFSGLDYTQHDEGITCTGGSFENGQYIGTSTFTGQNTVGGAVPIWRD